MHSTFRTPASSPGRAVRDRRWRTLGGAALALAAGTLALRAAAQTPAAPPKPPQQEPRKTTIGEVTISAVTLDFDLDARQFVAAGNVDLVSRTSHLTADRMTVQLTPERRMEWARCEGNVFLDRKDPEDGTRMTARAQTLHYRELEQKAELTGGVVIHQESPRLARPAEITGARVESDLAARVHIVHRGPDAQARVHVEPKGEEGKEKPEPVDLTADRLEMNGRTQEYVATGNPAMVRPSARLRARRIRFQVEEKTNEVRVAYAEQEVVFDGQGQNGSVVHATGDQGIFDREANEIVLTGRVEATTREPGDEHPILYRGERFTYNTRTRKSRLSSGGNSVATIVVPPGKLTAPATPETPARPQQSPARPEKAPAAGGQPRSEKPSQP